MVFLWTVVLFSHGSVNQLEDVLVEVIDELLVIDKQKTII